jgi:hypothetical protein
MLNLRTDWTAEELMVLANDANTRIERVDGTLLMSHYSGYWVQFALVPDGCMADFGDAEFVLEIDAPASESLPLASGVYRLVAVGRAPKMSPSQHFYDAWYDDSGQLQRIYRVNDYPMLHIGGSQDERIGWFRDKHGNQKPVRVTDDWRSYLIGTRGKVIECANAVVTLTPYDKSFIDGAKRLGGRWYPPLKAWVFPVQKADAVRDLVEEVYRAS